MTSPKLPGAGDERPSAPKPSFDHLRPTAARQYDYLLGGKDNFAADRELGDDLREQFAPIEAVLRENRRCLERFVRYLAADFGVRQFLDIGVGLPRSPNVHEIAQSVDPRARVVYVDSDPLVAVHARALLTSPAEGASVFVTGDLRNPTAILANGDLRATLDFGQPIALLLVAVLHFLDDSEGLYAAVRQLVDALPLGSYVALTHGTLDGQSETAKKQLDAMARAREVPFYARSRDQVAKFLVELTLVEPGIVSTVEWHPDIYPHPGASAAEACCYAAMARVSSR